jgi:hypothetical protein
MLTPTRPGNIGLSRELRCRFLGTALAQRITLDSALITLPGPVTVIARSALAFLDWLLDHHAQRYLDYRLRKLLLRRFQPVSIEAVVSWRRSFAMSQFTIWLEHVCDVTSAVVNGSAMKASQSSAALQG